MISWSEVNIRLLNEFLDVHYRNDVAVHRSFELLHHASLEDRVDGITAMLVLLKFYAEDNLRIRKALVDQIMKSPSTPIIFPKGDSHP
jgi:hypothetical protein